MTQIVLFTGAPKWTKAGVGKDGMIEMPINHWTNTIITKKPTMHSVSMKSVVDALYELVTSYTVLNIHYIYILSNIYANYYLITGV